MKKTFSFLIICFILSFTFVLTGCNLFPRNYSAYLNQSVITLGFKDGTTKEITAKEYITAYNSYGSSLVSNGSTYEEATRKTLDVLTNRAVLLKEAKKNITLNEADKKEILDDVYNSFTSYLNSYITQVREDFELDDATASEESTSSSIVYTAFTPTAEVVEDDGVLKIKLLDTTEEEQTTNFANLDAVITAFNAYANPTDTTTRSRIYKEAYRRYVSALKANEKNLGLSTDTQSVFKRHAEETYKNTEENLYITKLEDFYVQDGGFSTISVEQVLNKYKALLLQSKFKYENDATAFDTAMLESYNATNYVVNDDYFFVSHILIKFDETQVNADGLTQKQQYEKLESEKAYITEGEYQQQLFNIIGQIKANVRNLTSGEVTANRAVSAGTVLNNLKADLNAVSTDEQKANVFRNYVYMYNEDDGVMNAEYPYVIGSDSSKMVESFTEDAREIRKTGEFGTVSENLVVSEYGVHILFYAGECENLFTITNYATFDLEEEDINELTNAKLSPFNNKTVFDLVFSQLSNDSYSIFENMNLNILKKDVTITEHSDVYKNL